MEMGVRRVLVATRVILVLMGHLVSVVLQEMQVFVEHLV
jgi:hypothetical protein